MKNKLITVFGVCALLAAQSSYGGIGRGNNNPLFGNSSKAASQPLCSLSFYGQTSGGHHDRVEEPGVIVCDYPGSVTDAQCKDLKTAGANGTWCQKYSPDHKFLYSMRRGASAPCSESFYGQTSGGHHDRVEEPGVVVCDYPGSVTDAQCKDLQTAGANGSWCQKYSADHKFLYSMRRGASVPCSESFYGQTSAEHHDRVEEPGVVVCDYPGSVTDDQCKDLKTAGANGSWCQKYSADHKFLFSLARKAAPCSESFYGQSSSGHHDRVEEPGVVVCDYPASVTDDQCKDLKTAGANGTWCQKYSADHKFLFSLARKPSICSETFYGQSSSGHHDRVEEPGVIVCDYPASVTDDQCKDLKTSGSNGTWCQKYSADHKFLFSLSRKSSGTPVRPGKGGFLNLE